MQVAAPQVSVNTAGQTPQNQAGVPLKGLTPNGLVAGSLLNGIVVDIDSTRTVITLLGGPDVELPPQPDLNRRDPVTLTVLSVRPQIQVRVAKTDTSEARSAEDVGLRDGQTTAARVLARNPDGTAQIDLNGHVVTAEAPRDVEVGSLLPVKARDLNGHLMLTIMRGEQGLEALAQYFLKEHVRTRDSLGRMLGSLVERLRALLELGDAEQAQRAQQQTSTTDAQPQLSGLKQLLEFFQLPEEPQQAAIERSVQDGGLFLESKLAEASANPKLNEAALTNDLKAALLRASQEAPPADSKLQELLQSTTQELERLQLSNVLSQINEGALLWQIPGWPNSSPVSLRIERDDQTVGRDDMPPAWQFLVSVDVDRLGPVRVDSRLQGGTFRAIFYVAHEHVETLRSGLSALQQELTGEDFSKVMLAVRDVDDIPPSIAQKFQDASDGAPSSVSVFDVKG